MPKGIGAPAFLRMAVLAMACASFVGCSGWHADASGPPRAKNVILISMDTVRADHLGCYGYHRRTSPRLDKYAAQGTLFVNCTSPSSWTVPAHLTMLTGLEPATHGCVYYDEPGRLNENYETMAKIFTGHGFQTAAFTGGGYAGERHGMDIGFQHFESRGRHFEDNLKALLRWLDENGDQPFFLFFHGFNAHRPYLPPPPYKERFAGDYQGNYNVREFGPWVSQPSAEDLEYIISQYDGEIAMIDDILGYFFAELDSRGILKDSLVVITSDHGDEFYEHGSCDHIRTLYDELVRVPWIMFGPGVPARKVHSHVGTVDILPTVLALMDVQVESPCQGSDQSPRLASESTDSDTAIFTFTGMMRAPFHYAAVRTKKWKLISTLPAGTPNPHCWECKRGKHRETQIQLLDLEADPGEKRNVADDHPDVVQQLYGDLQDRIQQCNQLRMVAQSADAPSAEYLNTLKSLGYLGGEEEGTRQNDEGRKSHE
jgi:arylsulfatase A-like enzyme